MQTTELPVDGPAVYDEMRIIRLAREIARQQRDLGDILNAHGVSKGEFERLRKQPYFTNILTSELSAWEAADNVDARVKLKSAALIEEWLPELYYAMSDRKESLHARVKAGELAAKLAGLGISDMRVEGAAADRVQITINMGADKKVEVNKSLVLEHEENIFSQAPPSVLVGIQDDALQTDMHKIEDISPPIQRNTRIKEEFFQLNNVTKAIG
jgi:hypothetical protein